MSEADEFGPGGLYESGPNTEENMEKHEAEAIARTIPYLEEQLEQWDHGTSRGDLAVTIDALKAYLAMFAPTTEGHPVA